jgi:hypothetical protein
LLLSVGEVEVKGPLGGAPGGDELVEPGRVVSVRPEQLGWGVEHALAGVGAADHGITIANYDDRSSY